MLDDAERLRLYAQSAVSMHQALGASLAKAESKLQHWKHEAKVGAEKIERAEKERDEAKQEAKVARLAVMAADEAKERVEDELTRARDALAATKEDRRGLEAEVARLSVERMSLLLELEASRDEVSALHSQADKDKESMVEYYQTALEHIFAYGYGCCVFKHGICGDWLMISDGMTDSADPLPLEFFANLGCPPDPNTRRGRGYRGAFGRNGEGSSGGHRSRGVGLTLSLILVLGYF